MPTNLIEVTDAVTAKAYLMSLNTVKYFVEDAQGITSIYTPVGPLHNDLSEAASDLVPLAGDDLARLTEKVTDRVLAVNRRLVQRVVKNSDGSARIVFVDATAINVKEAYTTVKPIFTAFAGGGAGSPSTVVTGPTITGDGSLLSPLNLASTTVTPGTYTNATIIVDSQGRITFAESGASGPSFGIHGPYASDAAAASGGVAVGQIYELTVANIYGLPAGILKKRIS